MLLNEYFVQLLDVVDRCAVISVRTITVDARTTYTGIIRGSLYFINHMVLHFTEVVDVERDIQKIKYRYHFQHFDTNERIFRYDNVKHFPNLPTFPHHKHVGAETTPDKVVESSEISLQEILKEIEKMVLK